MSSIPASRLLTSLTLVASACALAACGGSDNNGGTTANNSSAATTTLKGVVNSTAYVAGSSAEPTLKTGYYQGALVCIDANSNGHCDADEAPVATDAKGAFSLNVSAVASLIADVPATAVNTANGVAVGQRTVLRASAAQIADQGNGAIVISPMTSEIQRLVEANATDYATEKANLAARAGVSGAVVVGDINNAGNAQAVIAAEAHQLENRFAYAIKKLVTRSEWSPVPV